MERELQQKRVHAREKVKTLGYELEGAIQLESALRRELASNQPRNWGIEQALEWTQRRVQMLNQERERTRQLIQSLERWIREGVVDENVAIRFDIAIRLQDRSLPRWEREVLELGLEEDHLPHGRREQEITPKMKQYVEQDLERTKSEEEHLTRRLEQMRARVAVLKWGLARAQKS